MRVSFGILCVVGGLIAATGARAVPITSSDLKAAEVSGQICTTNTSCAVVRAGSTYSLTSPGTVRASNGSYLTFDLGADTSPTLTAYIKGGLTPVSNTVFRDQNGVSRSQTSFFGTPSGSAVVHYYAEIFTSDPALANIPIAIDLAYSLTTQTTGSGASARAEILLNPSAHAQYTYLVNEDQIGNGIVSTGASTNSFRQGTLTDFVLPNTQFEITMLVLAQTSLSGHFDPNATAFASVDPALYIDPSYALINPNYLTDYQIVLSPGAGNVEAVPEPLTLTMFGVGLAGALATRRRRRTRVQ